MIAFSRSLELIMARARSWRGHPLRLTLAPVTDGPTVLREGIRFFITRRQMAGARQPPAHLRRWLRSIKPPWLRLAEAAEAAPIC